MTAHIEVDFNSRDDFGSIPAVVEEMELDVRRGDLVELFDDEGNRCLGIVASVHQSVVGIDPVWATFASADEARLVVSEVTSDLWSDWRNRLTVYLAPRTVREQLQIGAMAAA